MVGSLGGPTRAGVEATEDVPSSMVEAPRVAIGQATPAVVVVAETGLERPVRA